MNAGTATPLDSGLEVPGPWSEFLSAEPADHAGGAGVRQPANPQEMPTGEDHRG